MAFPLLAAADHANDAVWITTRDKPALGRFDVLADEWRWFELPPFPHAPSPDGRGGCWTALTRSSAVAHVDADGDVRIVRVPRSHELLVSVLAAGNVWVVDAHRRRLLRIDDTTDDLLELALPDEFVRPDFVAVGPDQSVWVADTRSSRIARVTALGADVPVVSSFEGPHRTRALLLDPTGAGMWLGAADRPQLTLLSPDGHLVATELRGVPFGLCALDDGRIAVCLKDEDMLCLLDPRSGQTEIVQFRDGSLPIGCAALGGSCFVTLAGASEVAEVPISGQTAGIRVVGAEFGSQVR